MLDAIFDETVTLRRAQKRGVKGDVTFAEVLDGTGGPLPIPCKIERRRKRTYTKDGQTGEVDGTLICRRTSEDFPEIALEDLLVTKTGEAFKVASLDEDLALFSTDKYLKIGLIRTTLPVPADKQDG